MPYPSPDWQTPEMKELFKSIIKVKDYNECAQFMRDLCTISELRAMAERWAVAKLVEKEVPYREIYKRTGVSTATITRVAHWLHHGEGGYKRVLAKTK